jgi:glucose-6-phosphate 1-dehydrogenase
VLGEHPLPPYVRLIHDVLLGDRSLFTRPDGLEHVWRVAGALLADKPEPVTYPTPRALLRSPMAGSGRLC